MVVNIWGKPPKEKETTIAGIKNKEQKLSILSCGFLHPRVGMTFQVSKNFIKQKMIYVIPSDQENVLGILSFQAVDSLR